MTLKKITEAEAPSGLCDGCHEPFPHPWVWLHASGLVFCSWVCFRRVEPRIKSEESAG